VATMGFPPGQLFPTILKNLDQYPILDCLLYAVDGYDIGVIEQTQ
jgi:hypothetical protein